MDKTTLNEIYFKNLLKTSKNDKFRAKRKISELIIEELDNDIDKDFKKKQEDDEILGIKTPIYLNTVSSPDISDELGSQFAAARTIFKTNKRTNLNTKRTLINILDHSQIPTKTPEKKMQTRVSIIIEDNFDENSIESPKLPQRLSFTKPRVSQIQKKYDIDNILNDKSLELNKKTPEKLSKNLNIISTRDSYLLNEIELEKEKEKETRNVQTSDNYNLEKLSESASSLSLNESHELTNDKLNKFINYKKAIENLIDENINENQLQKHHINEDLNITSRLNYTSNTNNATGTEWLKEKLIDETLNKTECLNKTSGLDLINCNLFLSENDMKKKKTKLVKNGYAERLQKIILRQSSSINFIRHNMNKEKSQFKSIRNSIIAVPFYQESSFNRQFSLLFAYNYSKTDTGYELNRTEKLIYILVSNEIIESNKLFDEHSKPISFIRIYPPWKRMVLKSSNISIYFCTELVGIHTIENELIKDTPNVNNNKILVDYRDLKCVECNNENPLECKLILFDVKTYMMDLKRQIGKDRLNSNRYLMRESNIQITTCNNTQNYLFDTQTDADYYVNQIDPDTQYMRINSILDALENIGYYGFITFKATVQRIGIVKNQLICSTFSDSLLKKHVLISDKFGMFALIIFPYEFTLIEESNKYQFNTVKFLEKQALSKENSLLYDQVRFLWEEMNEIRKKDSKSALKTSPKSIYVFEFVNGNRSSLDCLGPSKKYLPLKDFESLEAAYNDINETNNVLFFDLNDVVPIKLYPNDKGYLLFVYIIADDNVQSIQLENLDHFFEIDLIDKLNENYIPVEHSFLFKNIQMTKINDKMFDMNSNCYSYSEITSRNNTLLIKQIKNKFDFINNKTIRLNSFLKISGKVMNICEENCCFELICSRCKYDLNSSINSESSTTQKLNKYVCDSCGLNNENPKINVKMQVVLNCLNISLIVKINLHYKTIECLLPLNTILNDNEGFDVTLVIDKTIESLYAFIYKLNDTELFADELYFD